MKKTINVLASDFENNSYWNFKDTLKGCPLTRALLRAFNLKKFNKKSTII